MTNNRNIKIVDNQLYSFVSIYFD